MRKGLTLIEILIVIAVSSLLLVTVISSFRWATNLYIEIEKQQEVMGGLKNIETYSYNKIANSEELEILDEIATEPEATFFEEEWHYIYSFNGDIYYVTPTGTKTKIFYSDEQSYELEFNIKGSNNKILSIEVKENKLTTKEKKTDIKLSNLFETNVIVANSTNTSSNIIRFKNNLPIENETEMVVFMFDKNEQQSSDQTSAWGKAKYEAKTDTATNKLEVEDGLPVYKVGSDLQVADGNRTANVLMNYDGEPVFEQIIYMPVDKGVNLSALKPTITFEGERVYKDNMLISWEDSMAEQKVPNRTYNWQNESIIRVESGNIDNPTGVAVYKIITYVEEEPTLHEFNFLGAKNTFLVDSMKLTTTYSGTNPRDSIGYIDQGYDKIYCNIINLDINDLPGQTNAKTWVPTFEYNGSKVTYINAGDEPSNEIEIKNNVQLSSSIKLPLYPDKATIRVYYDRTDGTQTFKEYDFCVTIDPIARSIAYTKEKSDGTYVSYENVMLEENPSTYTAPNVYYTSTITERTHMTFTTVAESNYRTGQGVYNWDMLGNTSIYQTETMSNSETSRFEYETATGQYNFDNIVNPHYYDADATGAKNERHLSKIFSLGRGRKGESAIFFNNVSSPAVLKELTFIKETAKTGATGTPKNGHLYNKEYPVKAEIVTDNTGSNGITNNSITLKFLRGEDLTKLTPIFNFSGNRVSISYDSGSSYKTIASGIDTINLSKIASDSFNVHGDINYTGPNTTGTKKTIIKVEYDSIDGSTKSREYEVIVQYYDPPSLENVELIKNGREVYVDYSAYNYVAKNSGANGIEENRPEYKTGTPLAPELEFYWFFQQNGSSTPVNLSKELIDKGYATDYTLDKINMYHDAFDAYFKNGGEIYCVVTSRSDEYDTNFGGVIAKIETNRFTVSGVIDFPYTMYSASHTEFQGETRPHSTNWFMANGHVHANGRVGDQYYGMIINKEFNLDKFKLEDNYKPLRITTAPGSFKNHHIRTTRSANQGEAWVDWNMPTTLTGSPSSSHPYITIKENDKNLDMPNYKSELNQFKSDSEKNGTHYDVSGNMTFDVGAGTAGSENIIGSNFNWIESGSTMNIKQNSADTHSDLWNKLVVIDSGGYLNIKGKTTTLSTTAPSTGLVDVTLGSPDSPVILYHDGSKWMDLGGNNTYYTAGSFYGIDNLKIYGLVYSTGGHMVFNAKNVEVVGSIVGGSDIYVGTKISQYFINTFTVKQFNSPETNLNYNKIVLY